MTDNCKDPKSNVQRLAETKQNTDFRKTHFRCLTMREKRNSRRLLGTMEKSCRHRPLKARGIHSSDIKSRRIQELSQYQKA